MNAPLISIVLPTYNVAGYIERSLRSCLDQSFSDFEIIVVDDCGIDNSIEIAYKYSKKDRRIRVIHNDRNLGTFHARKNGALHATGNYILYLDPDDELADGALELIFLQIDKAHGLDLLLFNTQYVPELKLLDVKPKVPLGTFEKEIARNILKGKKLPYGTPGKLYSKRALIKSYVDLSIPESTRLVYGEDVLVFAGVLLNSNLAKGIEEKIYIYHCNETSITMQKNPISITRNIEQLDLVIEYLGTLKAHPNFIENFKFFTERLEIDKLRMRRKIVEKNSEYLKIMLKILSKTYSWRAAATLIVFFITLTRKKF